MPEKKKNNDKENSIKIKRKCRKSFISLFNIANESDTTQSIKRRTCRFCVTTTKLRSPFNFQHHIRSFCPTLRNFLFETGFGQLICYHCSSTFSTVEEGHCHVLANHEEEVINCNFCAKEVAVKDCKTHVTEHFETARSKSQKCIKCLCSFDNAYQFLDHLVNKHRYNLKTITTSVVKRHLMCHCPFSLLAVIYEKEQFSN